MAKSFLLWMIMVCIHLATRGQAGTLDPSFGVGGIATSAPGVGSGVVVLPGGAIVASGYHQGPQNTGVVRYLQDGTMDGSFGIDGVASANGPGGWGRRSVAVRPDGRIAVLRQDFNVVQFNENGELDSLFGVNGTTTIDVTADYNYSHSMAMQQDGKLLLIGRTDSPQGFLVTIIRVTEEGLLDTGFGSGGVVSFADSGLSQGRDIVVQDDGKVVALCWSNSGTFVLRYMVNGALDTSFGIGGQALVADLTMSAWAIAMQADGRIVVGGGGDGFIIARLNTDGTPDLAFGNQGMAYSDPVSWSSGMAFALAVQADGSLLQAGMDDNAFAMVRYLPDGSVDQGFGNDGVVLTDVAADADGCWDMTLQPDGKILLSGNATVNGSYRFVLLRYLNDFSTAISPEPIAASAMVISPNPSRSTSSVSFRLPQSDVVAIDVVDMDGRCVRRVLHGAFRSAGSYVEELDLSCISAGHYFLFLQGPATRILAPLVKE
ncbi:MAG: hypothetical protein IPL52_14510 [Flavobacteriales bacterium]|nr:hypothetical protein [Flavobacteriales bacterium]